MTIKDNVGGRVTAFVLAPQGCSGHSSVAGPQRIAPRRQRRHHPVGKDDTPYEIHRKRIEAGDLKVAPLVYAPQGCSGYSSVAGPRCL
jgi:hypothetical protein